MDYSNPKIPEGINTSKHHPLKDFFILTIGVLGTITLCVFLLGLFVERLAIYIPFSIEQQIMEKTNIKNKENNNFEIQNYLQQISNNLLPHIGLPKDLSVTINYVDDPVKNAFATLGGYISIHRGLIELLPNENALAMVIAHEIAHIKHRDPVVALGRGIVVGLFLSALAGTSSDRYIGNVITKSGTLTVLSFNRKQEERADEIALKAIVNYYGYADGADDLFKIMSDLGSSNENITPELLRTHPLDEDRFNTMKNLLVENKWKTQNKTIPLPNFIINLKNKSHDAL
jgi:predicted Zn-dependent protease